MAKLSSAPTSSQAIKIESLRKMFLKQNRGMAISHSKLLEKVSQLEESMSRLRTENLDLRKENLILRKRNEVLQKQLGTGAQDTIVGSDLNELNEIERYQAFHELVEEKLVEFNQLFGLIKNGQSLSLCNNANKVVFTGQHKSTYEQSDTIQDCKIEQSNEIINGDYENDKEVLVKPKLENVNSFVNKSRRRHSRRRESGLIQNVPNLLSSDEEENDEVEYEKDLLPVDVEDSDDEEDQYQESQVLKFEAAIPEEPELDSDESFKFVPLSKRKQSAIQVLSDERPSSQSPAKTLMTTTTVSTPQKPAYLSQKQINIIHTTASSKSPTKVHKTHLTQKKTSPKENDTMPISTTTSGAEDMRPVRRRRRSNTVTNYALPSLRTKMRREKDLLGDAVLLKKRRLGDHDTDPIII